MLADLIRGIRFFFQALAFSNIFLSLSVTSLVFETTLILGDKIQNYRYPFFLFSATLFLYCFHRLYKFPSGEQDDQLSARHLWFLRNRKIFFAVFCFAGIGVMLSLIVFVPARIIFWLLPIALISFGYTIPCIPYKKRLIRLRDIPFLKIFLISIVLGLTTVLLPVLAYSEPQSLLSPAIYFVFLRRLFFIFAITIPFDIRDIEYDQKKKTVTFPIRFGIKRSQQIAGLSLVIFSLLIIAQFILVPGTRIVYVIALIFSAIVSAMVIAFSGTKRSDTFYSFYLEGMMLLQCLLVMLLSKF